MEGNRIVSCKRWQVYEFGVILILSFSWYENKLFVFVVKCIKVISEEIIYMMFIEKIFVYVRFDFYFLVDVLLFVIVEVCFEL